VGLPAFLRLRGGGGNVILPLRGEYLGLFLKVKGGGGKSKKSFSKLLREAAELREMRKALSR